MNIEMAKCRIPFSGYCDLDLDLVFRIFVSGVNLSYYLRLESQIWLCVQLGIKKCRVPSLGHCDLDLDLCRSF